MTRTEKENLVPVWERITISLEEAAAYSGMVLKNYIGGMAVVDMSGRPAQRQDQAARIARFAVTPESLRVSMTLRV